MAEKQKATGVVTLLSAVSVKICCPFFAFCLKNACSPFALALRTGTIYRTETQTDKFLNFFGLFVTKLSSLSDFCH